MKKTVSINISGIIFNIDEDAYEKLQQYLAEISNRFSSAEEGKEIIGDIEARIAELFSQRVNDQKQVVTIEIVTEVIGIMGNPSDFGGEENTTQQKEEESARQEKTSFRDRRIYRDPENRVIGGVCSGLGAYFNIDPVFIRILMVITFFAFGPLLYIVLWIAIPKARTTAQKLEMKGEKVNISNIERSIKEEFEDVKQNFKNMKNSQTYRDSESVIEKIGHLIVVVITAIGKLFVMFFGIIFLIVGISLLVAFLATFVFGVADISIGDSAVSASQFLSVFIDNNDTTMAFISIFLLISIPVFAIIYGGIKLIFKIKTGNKVVGWSLSAVWVICLVYMLIFAVGEAKNYKMKDQVINRTFIREKTDTLYLKAAKEEFTGKKLQGKNHWEEEAYRDHDMDQDVDFDVDIVDGAPRIKGTPQLSIEKCDSNYIEVIVKKKARGKNPRQAKENASIIEYSWNTQVVDSTRKNLLFNRNFFLKKGGKWRAQNVDVIVRVPAGKVIVLDKNLSDMIYDVQNTSDMYDADMAGKTWVMKPEGLTFLK